ncbi:MAG: NAD-binding protein, partial [Planctomycetota bacterium]
MRKTSSDHNPDENRYGGEAKYRIEGNGLGARHERFGARYVTDKRDRKAIEQANQSRQRIRQCVAVDWAAKHRRLSTEADLELIEEKSILRLVIGCGYLGERVAKRWRDAGDRVTVVTRNADRAASLPAGGYRAIVADVTDPATLVNLPAAETVLFAVGYDRSAGPSINEVYAEGLRNVLSALPETTGRVIYISTTGVYGNAGSDWVDEQTPTEPQRDGGKASLAAEEALR